MFTERRSEVGQVRIDAGASYTARGKGIYLVVRGAGTVGGQTMRDLTTVHLDAGETAVFSAHEATELLHFGLPNLAGVRMPGHDRIPAEAAE